MKARYPFQPGMVAMLGIGASLSAIWASPAAAVEASYGLGYSALLSNNIGLAHDRQSDWMNVVSGLFAARELSSTVDAHVYSQVQGRQFMRGTYNDDLLVALDSAGTWTISPKRLSVSAFDTFTQVPIDPLLSLAPSNQQNTNTFSAGPDATLQLTNIDDFLVGGRYTNIYYESSTLNSDRVSAYGRLEHRFDRVLSASANYEPTRVYFHDASGQVPDYTRHDVFGRLAFGWPTTSLSLDAGRTQIDPDSGIQRNSTLLRGAFMRTINSTSSYSLSASQDIGDPGQGTLVASPAFDGASAVPIAPQEFVVGGFYRARLADAAYLRHRTYSDDHAHLFWHKLEYDVVPVLDQTLTGTTLDFGHDINAAIGGGLFGYYVRTEYVNAPRTDIDRGIGGRAVYRFQPTLSFIFQLRYANRSSTVLSQSYDEVRGVVSVAYQSSPITPPNNPFLNYVNPIYR